MKASKPSIEAEGSGIASCTVPLSRMLLIARLSSTFSVVLAKAILNVTSFMLP